MRQRRLSEIQKYVSAYTDLAYGMGDLRRLQAEQMLQSVMPFKSYLDVGCGRGELICYAHEHLKIADVFGTEVVPMLGDSKRTIMAQAHQIPFADQSFDVVACLDVLEHLLPDDIISALGEMRRIARKAIILTVSDAPSIHKGVEMHITRWPYHRWARILLGLFPGWTIEQPKSFTTFNQPYILRRDEHSAAF